MCLLIICKYSQEDVDSFMKDCEGSVEPVLRNLDEQHGNIHFVCLLIMWLYINELSFNF